MFNFSPCWPSTRKVLPFCQVFLFLPIIPFSANYSFFLPNIPLRSIPLFTKHSLFFQHFPYKIVSDPLAHFSYSKLQYIFIVSTKHYCERCAVQNAPFLVFGGKWGAMGQREQRPRVSWTVRGQRGRVRLPSNKKKERLLWFKKGCLIV